MAVVIASNVRKEHSGTPLFDGVSFKVERRDRLALAGPNGAGKTTLLRILAGETEKHGGEIAFAKGTRVALHDQRPPLELGLSLREYALSGAGDLLAAEDDLRRLEQAMAGGAHDAATLRRYSEAQGRLEHAGGYAWRDRLAGVLRGLGFRDEDLDRGLETFSGGELTRASLARALGGDPDLLLLDEPTNHLDMASLEWLEEELRTLDAAVMLVAHDRWFLEAVANSVLELDRGRSVFFAGPWHAWRQERAARELHAAKTAERQAEELARLDRFVARFRYGTKSRQAQSKLKAKARLEANRVEAPRGARRTLGFEFLKPARSGRVVLEVVDEDVAIGGKTLLRDVSFAIERGEHVALVGPNGAGKTTLLEQIVALKPGGVGSTEPPMSGGAGFAGAGAGRVRIGHGVEIAYFSQQEVELPTRGTVLEAAQSGTGLQRPQAQALLGRFLFSGWDEHEKQVVSLSGGERRRLALAIVVASGANFLVLDEPTNHLDLESRESLEAALEAFPGTLLLVTHDRALLDAVAERILAVEDGTIRSYEGGWADYVRVREEVGAKAAGTEQKPVRAKPKPAKPAPRRPSELERLEQDVEAAEKRIAELETKLADDWTNVDTLAEHRAARDELQSLLTKWEQAFEAQAR